MNKNINNNYFSFAILSTFILIIYSPIWTAHQTMSPDAYFLLPFFDKMYSLTDYLDHLFTFRAYDFQPIRDLSLFIDWKIFHLLKINTFVFQNLIFWIIACFYLLKILELIIPNLGRQKAVLLTLCYSAYPVFCATLPWSIARKHIMAFTFIVLSTYFFIKFLENNKNKNIFYLCFFYFLSVFSQPIGILWPFWAMSYVFVYHKNDFKKFVRPLLFLGLIFIISFTINYLYYQNSAFFAAIFESKTNDTFNIGLKILGFGNYMYQLFFPYFQVFQYDLNYKYTLLGYLCLISFLSLYYLTDLPWKKFILWSIFGLLPLIIILNSPRLIMDSYLLIPSVSILMVIGFISEKLNTKKFMTGSVILLFIWSAFTFKESFLWKDEIAYGMRNFERRPNCVNARSLGSTIYAKGLIPPKEVSEFIISNECFGFSTQYNRVEFIVFMSYVTFYENIGTIDEKIKILTNYSNENFFPKLALAALLISNNRGSEAIKPIEEIAEVLGDGKLDNMYDKTISTIVHKYCEQIQHERCLKFSSQLSKIVELPYF